MADVHIGSWRDPRLKELSINSFVKALKICEQENVDFILIAGDLFNTALPSIDNLKTVVKELKILKEKNISIYIIPGSHDYSPSGKTMIDVLEEAGLAINVVKGKVEDNKLFLKFTVDEKTKAKITGMLGKKGQLEKNIYESLDLESLEKENGFKIFMFHSAIAEMMPKEFALMDAMPLSMLPKNMDYYAGGHVHIVKQESFPNHKNIVYPGPLFPANFQELENIDSGFYIYDNEVLKRQVLNMINTFVIDIDANHKTPEEVIAMIDQKILKKEFLNTIVLIKIKGTLKTGKVSDINFNEISTKIYSQGAFYVMKNTSKLSSEEFEEIKINTENIEDLEDSIIKEHLQQVKVTGFKDKEYNIIKDLMKTFESEKHEGEKVHEYEDRIRKEADKVLDV